MIDYTRPTGRPNLVIANINRRRAPVAASFRARVAIRLAISRICNMLLSLFPNCATRPSSTRPATLRESYTRKDHARPVRSALTSRALMRRIRGAIPLKCFRITETRSRSLESTAIRTARLCGDKPRAAYEQARLAVFRTVLRIYITRQKNIINARP
jgi:hypothetical protein